MSTGAIVLIIVVVVLVIAGALFAGQLMRRRRLRERFGPEYDRSIEEADNRRVAERVLTARQKRHAGFELKPLSDSARVRYAQEWTLVQEHFVDQPDEAVAGAENLVDNVMRERGYPTDGFDQQAADLSVDHATAVDHYRTGHDIRTRHEQAGVSTEDLRTALVHYRKVFVALVGVDAPQHTDDRVEDRVDEHRR
ncbi:hypothetical protein [Actinophytocola sp.]|jgi:Fe-S cluster assembly scaffold protein SufB|uniref:hypothetical protein n=1 Tax=Actinophytocola sp. TaxID=1872138 RepID=UPI002EDA9EB5